MMPNQSQDVDLTIFEIIARVLVNDLSMIEEERLEKKGPISIDKPIRVKIDNTFSVPYGMSAIIQVGLREFCMKLGWEITQITDNPITITAKRIMS